MIFFWHEIDKGWFWGDVPPLSDLGPFDNWNDLQTEWEKQYDQTGNQTESSNDHQDADALEGISKEFSV